MKDDTNIKAQVTSLLFHATIYKKSNYIELYSLSKSSNFWAIISYSKYFVIID